ncbi:methylene-fatty-acyl-phospholipid synthase [Moniliophthora roreri MCA 2997]|uniref:Phosphatidyl-N-methylethanolamine N-methyltransferase n=2 Tax=Moniliophthora roreri TaxID=221103 RepID=V2XYA8_MONRO|nr:methylene-fatty-acyl-phospholipid synthase [Moniliophthora roreri MCA 2997]KAI3614006.1 methylene-fatty-acyl-phospholipid synthase [Moniliophthora roreri]
MARGWGPLELFSSFIDLTQPSLYISLLSVGASPLVWNLVGRNEYRNRTLTKAVGARIGCAILGITIFIAGLLRDVLYKVALFAQPHWPLPYFLQTIIAWLIFGAGNFLVATSFLALGFYGTYMGDYFGILQKRRVTGFPFNILKHPMYTGSTLCFVGAALWYERPAGLLVAIYVHATYALAVEYEGPFTDMIYAQHKS